MTQGLEWQDDYQYIEYTIKKVEQERGHYTITIDNGMCTGFDVAWAEQAGVVPRVGSLIRMHGQGLFRPIRSHIIIQDGETYVVNYITEDEWQQRIERESEDRAQNERQRGRRLYNTRLRRYHALNSIFKRRIERLSNLPDDVATDGFELELMTLEEAQQLVKVFPTVEALEKLRGMSYNEQRQMYPQQVHDDHSGFSWYWSVGMAKTLIDGTAEAWNNGTYQES